MGTLNESNLKILSVITWAVSLWCSSYLELELLCLSFHFLSYTECSKWLGGETNLYQTSGSEQKTLQKTLKICQKVVSMWQLCYLPLPPLIISLVTRDHDLMLSEPPGHHKHYITGGDVDKIEFLVHDDF